MIRKNDPAILRQYLEDSSNLKGGYADELIMPETIAEVSDVLRDANLRKIPVTISGGGTSTTGSRIPFGGIIMSLERLNKIISISRDTMSAVVQAGVFVDDLKSASDKEGLFYTSHPTEGTATIGGTVSTNASGARSFKYGPTRSFVRRLKVVLASGEILDIKRGEKFLRKGSSEILLPSGSVIKIPMATYKMPLVKNASGYFVKEGMDLIDLFIGQEGTLGVIVEVEMGLVLKPVKIISSFVFFKRKEDAWSFASDARDISKMNRQAESSSLNKKGIDALSIEYFDDTALSLLRRRTENIPNDARAVIFFEQDISDAQSEDFILGEWIEIMQKNNASIDEALVSMNENDVKKFSEFRHSIPEAVNDIVRQNGFYKFSADISVPDDKLFEMMSFYDSAISAESLDHVLFGHIGENHVHANLLPKTESEFEIARAMILTFVKKGISLGGTISAEHGVGKIKHRYVQEMYGESGITEMALIKKAFDPNCILGLGNIFSKKILKKIQ